MEYVHRPSGFTTLSVAGLIIETASALHDSFAIVASNSLPHIAGQIALIISLPLASISGCILLLYKRLHGLWVARTSLWGMLLIQEPIGIAENMIRANSTAPLIGGNRRDIGL